jgi:2-oxoglutarate ferredoxin oxidoreductase subunit gamma
MLQPGGTLVVNKSMVDRDAKRKDIKVLMVPCNQIAEELGSRKLLNMVAIGALVSALPELGIEALEKALTDHLPARHKDMLAKNHAALRRGLEVAKAQ